MFSVTSFILSDNSKFNHGTLASEKKVEKRKKRNSFVDNDRNHMAAAGSTVCGLNRFLTGRTGSAPQLKAPVESQVHFRVHGQDHNMQTCLQEHRQTCLPPGARLQGHFKICT